MSDEKSGCNRCISSIGSRGLDEVAVIGSGRLSREVASLSSMRGFKTHIFCQGEEAVGEAIDLIKSDLDRKVSRWTMSPGEVKAVMSRIVTHAGFEEIPEEIGLAIDCSTLSNDLRADFCKDIDSIFPPDVVIAANIGVSTLQAITKGLNHVDRFIGVRFSAPVWQTKTIEVFSNEHVDCNAVDLFGRFAKKLEKDVLPLNDIAGNISVRIFLTLFIEAVEMMEEENLEAEQVDDSLKDLFGMKIGPLEMADRIGLKILLGRCELLSSENGCSHLAPPAILKKLVEEEKFGFAFGEGFLKYDK